MHKTLTLALGAAILAAAAVQAPGGALAAKKGSERGYGFIRPGDSQRIIIYDKNKSIGDPNTKRIGDPNQRYIGDPGIKGIGDPGLKRVRR
jgi:hypothetical protein